MPKTNLYKMLKFTTTRAYTVLILSSCTLAQFMEEIPAPDLAGGENLFQPWPSPGSAVISQSKNSGLVINNSDRPPRTLQQELREKRGILAGVSTPEESRKPVESELSPVSVTVSGQAPPPQVLAGDQRCEYVQLMNSTMGEECAKGGMRCQRKCEPRTQEPVCTEEFTDVCEDVPEETCETVTEKYCKTVQEEVCDAADQKTMTKCTLEMTEECNTVYKEECEENVEMDCQVVDKQACTTIKEQVCQPSSKTSCHEEERVGCSLVPDAVCRNITQTRFSEKCWTREEEVCRTVYDTVRDKKCEMVNITVPQTECDTIQEIVMETECNVVNTTVKTPVCVTVMNKDVQKICEDVVPSYTCFEQLCSNISRPVFTKRCHEVMEEKCEVIIEQKVEQKCTKVEQIEFEEECTTKNEEECAVVEEYVCDEEASEAERPPTSYGAPQAEVITISPAKVDKASVISSSPSQKPTYSQEENSTTSTPSIDTYKAPQVPVTTSILASTIVLTTPQPGFGEKVATSGKNKRKLKGYERRPKKRHRDSTQPGPNEFIKKQLLLRQQLKASLKWNNTDEIIERSKRDSDYSSYDSFQQSLKPVSNVNSWVGLNIRKSQSSQKCSKVEKKECKSVPKKSCSQVPSPVQRDVCVEVTVPSPRQECTSVPRQECQVVETVTVEETCTVAPSVLPARQQCDYQVREMPEEVCQTRELVNMETLCQDREKEVPMVKCHTKMKEIELKEICVDIDIQLPREECTKEVKEECKYEPEEVFLNRCDPTVKEVCKTTIENICEDKCVEKCGEEEKRVCMTIPQQECMEKKVPKCRLVARDECKMVPEEKCTEERVEEDIPAGQCRINTRLDCMDRPMQKCGRTFQSSCRKVSTPSCTDRVTEECQMECMPVFWCKICT